MVNGVLSVDKPEGITSHDAVQHIRRAIHERRVGHAGTLDPFATGILVIAAGKATRLLEYMHMLPKTYTATFALGATSDTDDVAGIITETPKESLAAQPTKQEIQNALKTFHGTIQQIPPQYAAIKIQGKKMYELAREGKHVEAKPRTVTIHDIHLLSYTYPDVSVEITCSAGTYIRAIGRDLGTALGTGAYTKTLRRNAIGPFTEDTAVSLNAVTEDTLQTHLLPPETLVAHLPRVEITAEQQKDFEQGKVIQNVIPDPLDRHPELASPSRSPKGRSGDSGSSSIQVDSGSIRRQAMDGTAEAGVTVKESAIPLAIFNQSGSLIGIGKQTPEGAIKPDKVISL